MNDSVRFDPLANFCNYFAQFHSKNLHYFQKHSCQDYAQIWLQFHLMFAFYLDFLHFGHCSALLIKTVVAFRMLSSGYSLNFRH